MPRKSKKKNRQHSGRQPAGSPSNQESKKPVVKEEATNGSQEEEEVSASSPVVAVELSETAATASLANNVKAESGIQDGEEKGDPKSPSNEEVKWHEKREEVLSQFDPRFQRSLDIQNKKTVHSAEIRFHRLWWELPAVFFCVPHWCICCHSSHSLSCLPLLCWMIQSIPLFFLLPRCVPNLFDNMFASLFPCLILFSSSANTFYFFLFFSSGSGSGSLSLPLSFFLLSLFFVLLVVLYSYTVTNEEVANSSGGPDNFGSKVFQTFCR